MANNGASDSNAIIKPLAFVGAALFVILNLTTGKVPGGGTGAAIGGGFGGSLGFVIYFFTYTPQTPTRKPLGTTPRLILFVFVALVLSTFAMSGLLDWIAFKHPKLYNGSFVDALNNAWYFSRDDLEFWMPFILAWAVLFSGFACFERSIPTVVVTLTLAVSTYLVTDPAFDHFLPPPLPPKAVVHSVEKHPRPSNMR